MDYSSLFQSSSCAFTPFIPSHSLQPDAKNQALLFNMIADNFVALLHSMTDKYKDEIFMVYSVTCTYMYSGVHVRAPSRKKC